MLLLKRTTASLALCLVMLTGWGGCASVREQIASDIEYILPVQEASPGDIVPFSFRFPSEVKGGWVGFLGRNYRVYPRRDLQRPVYTAFLPVRLQTKPGDYSISCHFELSGRHLPLEERFPFQILPYLNRTPAVPVTARRFKLRDYQQDYRLIVRRLAGADYSAPAMEDFLLPLGGRVVATYGTERLMNRKIRVVLEGIEIEPLLSGSWEVNAAASGAVVLAQNLSMLGNTVVIDHGYSFATLYGHLGEIAVKVGDPVSRGQKLGRAGHTGGAAVGNRLLFQLFVAAVPVNVQKYMDLNVFR